jgi:hypothetical protein
LHEQGAIECSTLCQDVLSGEKGFIKQFIPIVWWYIVIWRMKTKNPNVYLEANKCCTSCFEVHSGTRVLTNTHVYWGRLGLKAMERDNDIYIYHRIFPYDCIITTRTWSNIMQHYYHAYVYFLNEKKQTK